MRFADLETVRRLCLIFAISFALNFVWEHLHSVLYVHYRGGPITDFVLLRATLGDALFITALSVPFFRISFLERHVWLVIPAAIASATLLELFAISMGRWAYAEGMPLIPFLGTGLTPTVQLAITGYIAFLTARSFKK